MLADIKKIIANELNITEEEVTSEKHLQKDLGADSIDAMNIVMNVEEQFSLIIEDEQLSNIKTVSDIETIIKNS